MMLCILVEIERTHMQAYACVCIASHAQSTPTRANILVYAHIRVYMHTYAHLNEDGKTSARLSTHMHRYAYPRTVTHI